MGINLPFLKIKIFLYDGASVLFSQASYVTQDFDTTITNNGQISVSNYIYEQDCKVCMSKQNSQWNFCSVFSLLAAGLYMEFM